MERISTFESATSLLFDKEQPFIYYSSLSGEVKRFDLIEAASILIWNPKQDSELKKSCLIQHLKLSNNGKFLAFGSKFNNRIWIQNLAEESETV